MHHLKEITHPKELLRYLMYHQPCWMRPSRSQISKMSRSNHQKVKQRQGRTLWIPIALPKKLMFTTRKPKKMARSINQNKKADDLKRISKNRARMPRKSSKQTKKAQTIM